MTHDESREPLEALAERFMDRRRSGEPIDVEAFAIEHPGHADEIRSLFPALLALEQHAPPAMPIDPGAERIGDYELLREVGRGGMGVVFEARDAKLGRRVALKLLPPQFALDPRFLERFQREAQAAAGLTHPNIVPVHGVGEQEGVHYYAMMFVDGLGLDSVIARVRDWRANIDAGAPDGSSFTRVLAGAELLGDATTVEHAAVDASPSGSSNQGSGYRYFQSAARLVLEAADALAYAHERGVLHRDIKPSNLMIDRRGKLWVTDFGLCKTEGSGDLTETGALIGSLRYMAPERFRGEGDARSDVYALGITLYELLTLQPAFEGADRAVLMRQVLDGKIARPRKVDPQIPPDLDTIVRKAIDPVPEGRYADARSMAEDLRAFLASRPISARPPSVGYLLNLAVQRNRALAATIAVALLCFVGLTAYYIVNLRGALDTAKEAGDNERKQRLAADAARGRAEAAQEAESREREEAEFQSYVAGIAAASAALDLNDVETARAHLENTPERHRRFEYEHLARRIDDALHAVDVAEGRSLSFAYTTAAAWSHDAAHIATIADRFVTIARARDGEILRHIDLDTRHAGVSIAASRTADWFLTGGGLDYAVRVFSFDAGAAPRPPIRFNTMPFSLAVAPGDRGVAVGMFDGTVRLLGGDFSPEASVRVGSTAIISLAYSADGSRLACAVGEEIVVVDVARKAVVCRLDGHRERVTSVTFLDGGRRVLSGARDATMRVWDVERRQDERVISVGVAVMRVGVSADERFFVSGTADGALTVWTRTKGRLRRRFFGHTGRIDDIRFSPDGRRLATTAIDRSLRVFEFDSTTLDGLSLVRVPVSDLAFTRDGSRIVTAQLDQTVRVWDAETLMGCGVLTGLHAARSAALAVSPDGRRAVAGRDKLRVYDLGTMTEEQVIDPEIVALDVDWHPREPWIAVGTQTRRSGAAEALLLDVESGEILRRWPHASRFVNGVAFSPDGTWLATAESKGTVRVYRVEGEIDGKGGEGRGAGADPVAPAHAFEAHRNATDLEWSADGTMLVSCGLEGSVRAWRMPEGISVLELGPLERRQLVSISVSPDGSRIASVARTGSVQLIDTSRQRVVATLPGVSGYTKNARFFPDGKRIVVFGREAVRVYDTRPREECLPALDRAARRHAKVAPRIRDAFARGTDERALLDELARDPTLDDAARAVATALVYRRRGEPAVLFEDAWRTVVRRDADGFDYLRVQFVVNALRDSGLVEPRIPVALGISFYQRQLATGRTTGRRAMQTFSIAAQTIAQIGDGTSLRPVDRVYAFGYRTLALARLRRPDATIAFERFDAAVEEAGALPPAAAALAASVRRVGARLAPKR